MDGAFVCMDLPILCFTIHCSDRVQDSVIHRRHSGSSDRNDHILYSRNCLLYTSDAADEEDSVALGGLRICKKKKKNNHPQ